MSRTTGSNEKTRGIFYVLLAAFFFSCMSLCVKLSGDLPFVEKSFYRNLVAIFFAFLVMKKKQIPFSPGKMENLKYLVGRSIAGTIGIFGNFYAIDRLVIADANMLNKLSPFFAILFSYFLLKERIKPYQLLCVIVAFIGALMILKPGMDSMMTFPAFIGMCGGMGAGMAYTCVRLAGKNGVPGPFIVFFFSVFSCLFSLPFMIISHIVTPHPVELWQIGMLVLGGMAAACGQFSITAAYTHAPASEISVYDYSQTIFAAILGMLFLNEMPDLLSVIGYVVIAGASVAMYLIRRRTQEDAPAS